MCHCRGFPPEAYKITYKAPGTHLCRTAGSTQRFEPDVSNFAGDPALARHIEELLR